MSIALDIGTQHLRSLRREGGRLVGRMNHAVYLSLPDKAPQRRILEKASIRYATCKGSLLVIGQSANDAAEMLDVPCIPLLINSRLPDGDPVARQVLMSLVDCLLPEASRNEEVCWVTIPGPADTDSPERRFFLQIIRLKGYIPRVVQPGLALVLAELGQNGFSGIGCDFGGGYTRTSFAYKAREYFNTSIARGSHWVDASLAEAEKCILWDSAGHQYLNTAEIVRWKRSHLISVFKPITEREQRMALLCEEVISQTLADLESHLASEPIVGTVREPLPLVCSGGLARLPGFVELLHDMVRDSRLSLEISEVRPCSEPDYTVARGCLILAELEGVPAISQVA